MSEILGVDTKMLQMEVPFKDIEDWDSLKAMELIVRIEDQFKCNFSGDQISKMTSPSSIEKMLREQKNG